jgi:nucleotide-binding universal stress UspA family protein
MLSTILLTLDGSPLAERALPFGEGLARATGARLVLVRSAQAFTLPGLDATEDQVATVAAAETYLENLAEHLRKTGLSVEVAVPYGAPAAEILQEIELRKGDLVVMATHGRSGPGRWIYGSVTDEVLRRSPVPLVVLPPAAALSWPGKQPPSLLVPLDGSALAEAALAPATDLAQQLAATVMLVDVVPWPPLVADRGDVPPEVFDPEPQLAEAHAYLAEVAGRLDGQLGSVAWRVELGWPEVVIARIAEEQQVDLIAMSTHGRTGVPRLVLGSVATAMLQRSTVPVFLVRPTQVKHAAEDGPSERLNALTL